ncbi:MAG: hypothetical protein CL858_24760 [Cupriavidus sp.]|nr:hypothetical protein [Cupriavidus sp.]
MQRIIVKALGGPEQLSLESVDAVPRPGPGQVLIDVEAAGVNYLDINLRKGASVHTTPVPYTPGLEGVGRVREAGDGVTLAAGQRVAWINVRGSYASQLVIPVEQAIPVPAEFTVSQSLLFQAMTAHYLAHEYRSVQPGDQVLVHAAAGGVGQLLVHWLKHMGA